MDGGRSTAEGFGGNDRCYTDRVEEGGVGAAERGMVSSDFGKAEREDSGGGARGMRLGSYGGCNRRNPAGDGHGFKVKLLKCENEKGSDGEDWSR